MSAKTKYPEEFKEFLYQRRQEGVKFKDILKEIKVKFPGLGKKLNLTRIRNVCNRYEKKVEKQKKKQKKVEMNVNSIEQMEFIDKLREEGIRLSDAYDEMVKKFGESAISMSTYHYYKTKQKKKQYPNKRMATITIDLDNNLITIKTTANKVKQIINSIVEES